MKDSLAAPILLIAIFSLDYYFFWRFSFGGFSLWLSPLLVFSYSLVFPSFNSLALTILFGFLADIFGNSIIGFHVILWEISLALTFFLRKIFSLNSFLGKALLYPIFLASFQVILTGSKLGFSFMTFLLLNLVVSFPLLFLLEIFWQGFKQETITI